GSLLSWTSLKECRELVPADYLEWTESRPDCHAAKVVFVSHRWITPVHPDPDGNQLRELQNRLRTLLVSDSYQDAVIFYDYCSMLQRPRTAEEDAHFYRDIARLESVLRSADITIILSEGYSNYRDRAWCFFEAMVSKKNVHLFDDQHNIK